MDLFPYIDDPAFHRQSEVAFRELCREVHEVTYIEHGEDTVVALVNEEYVFRFPRNDNAARRLRFETALLQKIGSSIQEVAIPSIAKVHTQPLYIVTRYIPGGHLTGQQMQSLSEGEQIAIGKKIASFIAQLNQAVSGLEVQRLRSEAGVDMLRQRWDAYFNQLFIANRLPNEVLGPIVQEYYSTWKSYTANEQRTHTIHDDLHWNNLLFVGPQLTGVVDFSETDVGSIEEELRWLYPMGDIVLKSAMARYEELTGTTVDYNHVRAWVTVQELATYIKRLANQQTESPHFLRAQEHLRQWIPNFPL